MKLVAELIPHPVYPHDERGRAQAYLDQVDFQAS